MAECASSIRIDEIRDPEELTVVAGLAGKIFPMTYADLIPAGQIRYMMPLMYGSAVLRREFSSGVKFALIRDGVLPVGYISWHLAGGAENRSARLEKLYLDFAYHGRLIGKLALDYVIAWARRSGARCLSLNVHKRNFRAQKAYCRVGFYRWYSEKEDVGNGFFKDDYVLRYDLVPADHVALTAELPEQEAPVGFVRLADVVPDVIEDIRYASNNNFIGDRIPGYERPKALITLPAALALREVAIDMRRQGCRLKIFDAYRPVRAVSHFVRWAHDPDDTRMKPYYYPNLDKSELIPRGYIAERSGHSRGSTVDLTLADAATASDVDMGGTFDWFGPESHPDWCGNSATGEYTGGPAGAVRGITSAQFRNRMQLRQAMLRHGFRPLAEEWWHFTLAAEPYPDSYFDYPVR